MIITNSYWALFNVIFCTNKSLCSYSTPLPSCSLLCKWQLLLEQNKQKKLWDLVKIDNLSSTSETYIFWVKCLRTCRLFLVCKFKTFGNAQTQRSYVISWGNLPLMLDCDHWGLSLELLKAMNRATVYITRFRVSFLLFSNILSGQYL